MTQIISRKEAKKLGRKQYFTGKPCKYGHIDIRFVANKWCRSCHLERRKIEYKINKNAEIAKTREWERQNPEKYKILKRKQYLKWKEAAKIFLRAWKFKNPEKVKAYSHKRRTKIGAFNVQTIQSCLITQNYKCIGCDRIFTQELKYTIDHIIPLSRGGTNWPDNIQLLCRSCNSSKGAKLMEEWVTFRKLYA